MLLPFGCPLPVLAPPGQSKILRPSPAYILHCVFQYVKGRELRLKKPQNFNDSKKCACDGVANCGSTVGGRAGRGQGLFVLVADTGPLALVGAFDGVGGLNAGVHAEGSLDPHVGDGAAQGLSILEEAPSTVDGGVFIALLKGAQPAAEQHRPTGLGSKRGMRVCDDDVTPPC